MIDDTELKDERLKQRDSSGKFLTGNTLGWQPGQSGNAKGATPNSVTTLLRNKTQEDNR